MIIPAYIYMNPEMLAGYMIHIYGGMIMPFMVL